MTKTIEKYKCDECGFMYDNRIGDDSAGISKDTYFEELPDDWHCPLCGAEKSKFYKV